MATPILGPEAFGWTLPLENSPQAITVVIEDFNFDFNFEENNLGHNAVAEGLSPGHGAIVSAFSNHSLYSDCPTQLDSDSRCTNSINLQTVQAQATVNPADLITAPRTQSKPSHWEPFYPIDDLKDASNAAHNDASLRNVVNSGLGLNPESASKAQHREALNGAQDRTTATTNSQTQSGRKRKAKSGSPLTWSKRRSQLPLGAVTILDDWFTAHQDNPYPTPGELGRLVEQSGLPRKQVMTWLNNARARKLQQTPMEAYVSSSSDGEAAKREDIRKAAESMLGVYSSPPSSFPWQTEGYATSVSGSSAGSAFDQCPEARQALPAKRGRRKYMRRRRPGSVSSLESFQARATAPPSSSPPHFGPYECAFPQCNQLFYRQIDLHEHVAAAGHHLGKKASLPTKGSSELADSEHQKKRPETMFQCTFCKIEIAEKSWKRHEESLHYCPRKWMCMPNGMPFVWLSPDTGTCMFCGTLVHATEAHDCHRIHDCLSRPDHERTFQRKDKLVQHLNQFHGVTLDESALKAWESKARDQSWKCGFCGKLLTTWDVRAKHIAKHFRDGFTMKDWFSDRICDYGDEELQNSALSGPSRSSFYQGMFVDSQVVDDGARDLTVNTRSTSATGYASSWNLSAGSSVTSFGRERPSPGSPSSLETGEPLHNGAISSAVSHVAKMQPFFYICECCHRNPRKFNTKEELE